MQDDGKIMTWYLISRDTRWQCNDKLRLTAQVKSALDHRHRGIITPLQVGGNATNWDPSTRSRSRSRSRSRFKSKFKSKSRSKSNKSKPPKKSIKPKLANHLSWESTTASQLLKALGVNLFGMLVWSDFHKPRIFVGRFFRQYFWRPGKAITWHPPLRPSPVFPWSVSNADALNVNLTSAVSMSFTLCIKN